MSTNSTSTQKHIDILFDVDQAEAIRRGYNATSTVKIPVDVSELSQDHRNALAKHFSGGFFRYNSRRLQEPTLEGVLDLLEHASLKMKEDDAATEARVRRFRADNYKAWEEFRTRRNTLYMHAFRNPKSGELELSKNCNFRGLAFPQLEPAFETAEFENDPRFAQKMKELEEINAVSENEARIRASQQFEEEEKKDAEKKERIQFLTDWARNKTPNRKLRYASETFEAREWLDEARYDYTMHLLRNLGFPFEQLGWQDGSFVVDSAHPKRTVIESERLRHPTDEQLDALKRIRKWCVWADASTDGRVRFGPVHLLQVSYASSDPDKSPDLEVEVEIQVKILEEWVCYLFCAATVTK